MQVLETKSPWAAAKYSRQRSGARLSPMAARAAKTWTPSVDVLRVDGQANLRNARSQLDFRGV